MSIAKADFRHEPAAPSPAVDIDDYMYGIAAFLGGTANVIMQLSWAPVGYGVLESTVDSGKVTLHPIKRARTTISYLAVALLGTDDERDCYRDALNGSHRPVRSGPGSPVKYNAFDPDLQLWVGACLYRGFLDTVEALRGPLDDAAADAVYQAGGRLATTLQVRPESWPADRVVFEEFWNRSLANVSIDPAIREYLYDLVMFAFIPLPIRIWLGPTQRFFVTGYLPQKFRDEMQLTWTDRDQRVFERIHRSLGWVNRRLPAPIRKFPINYCLWDLRRRMRLGHPLV